MDKLRALQYFLAAAGERSFSRAARELEVSVPAVVKLVNALERDIGAQLFVRSAQGLKLTANGARYLDVCQPLLAQLTAADEVITTATSTVRGTLIVGAHPQLAKCIGSSLPQFHTRCPDVQIDIRIVSRDMDIGETPADCFLVQGWPDRTDMVQRRIAQPRLLTCAAPGYWAKHGVPQRPTDLERHVCVLFCNYQGTVNDLWQYQRGKEREAITARGWLVSNNHGVTVNAALLGEGVGRFSDLFVGGYLRSGQLVPALLDWEMSDAPPINLLYAATERRNPRVRGFADFVTEVFDELVASSIYGPRQRQFAERPYWHRSQYRRASAASRKRNRARILR